MGNALKIIEGGKVKTCKKKSKGNEETKAHGRLPGSCPA